MIRKIEYQEIKEDLNALFSYVRSSVGSWFSETPLFFCAPSLTDDAKRTTTKAITHIYSFYKDAEINKLGAFENCNLLMDFFDTNFNKDLPLKSMSDWLMSYKPESNKYLAKLNIFRVYQTIVSEIKTLDAAFFDLSLNYEFFPRIDIYKKRELEIYEEDLSNFFSEISQRLKKIDNFWENGDYQQSGVNVGFLYELITSKISVDKTKIVDFLFPNLDDNNEFYKIINEWFKSISDVRNALKSNLDKFNCNTKKTQQIIEIINKNPRLYTRFFIDWTKLLVNQILENPEVLEKLAN